MYRVANGTILGSPSMQHCMVQIANALYPVDYTVSLDTKHNAPLIEWACPQLESEMEFLSPEEKQQVEADILVQCGAHWERHSGDDWKKGTAP